VGALACRTGVVVGEELLLYSFPEGHPMNNSRVRQFFARLEEAKAFERPGVVKVQPTMADEDTILQFHTREHLSFVKASSLRGDGYLDGGDTPAYKGVFEAASYVVGSTVKLLELVASGEVTHGFNPVGGLHHARRDSSAGFCVFNDIGVAIELAKRRYGLSPLLYVDMDAHHGDGVYYSYEGDPEVFIFDSHEDGRHLYPGTGFEWEEGTGKARGTKVNVPLQPGAGDGDFREAFKKALRLAERAKPQLVILQAGGDCLAGDPLTHLSLSSSSHRYATEELVKVSHTYCEGRLIALGGGGYNPKGVAEAWLQVVLGLSH